MLEIDPKLLLLTVVVFLLLIYVLNKLLFKPVLDFVDAREQSIIDGERELANYGKDTKKCEEESANILAKAREEVIAIKAEAVNLANIEAKAKLEERKAQLEQEYKEFEDKLKAENEELKVALSANLADIKSALKSKLSNL